MPASSPCPAYLDMVLFGNADGRYRDAPRTGWLPWLYDPRVIGVSFFALNGPPWEWSHSNLIIMRDDGTVAGTHPVYDLLAGVAD